MPADILVVNPIGTLRRLTIQALKNLGYLSVHECSSLDECQKKIQEISTKTVTILELNMAKLKDTEKEFIQSFSSEKNSNGHTLIVSTQTSDKSLNTSLQYLGVIYLISKDYDLQSFTHRLDQTLQNIFNS